MKKTKHQPELFTHDRENNQESESVLHEASAQADFKSQMNRLFDLLMAGKTLTVWEMYNIYKIGAPAQRIFDIRGNGFLISKRRIKNSKSVVYYMSPEDIIANKAELEGV